MEGVGNRLRQERIRLGMTQREMAFVGGVRVNAQYCYENDRRQLPATYLAAVAKRGVDLCFVILGARKVERALMAAEEGALIRNLRALDQPEREAFVRVITSLATNLEG